jgi:hypothetical protein
VKPILIPFFPDGFAVGVRSGFQHGYQPDRLPTRTWQWGRKGERWFSPGVNWQHDVPLLIHHPHHHTHTHTSPVHVQCRMRLASSQLQQSAREVHQPERHLHSQSVCLCYKLLWLHELRCQIHAGQEQERPNNIRVCYSHTIHTFELLSSHFLGKCTLTHRQQHHSSTLGYRGMFKVPDPLLCVRPPPRPIGSSHVYNRASHVGWVSPGSQRVLG